MTPVTDLLFVYGTLQREGAAHYLLAGKVTLLGVAWMQGLLFEVDRYPGAVLLSDSGHRVRGELYRMHDGKALLARLDVYEETGPQHPVPHEYRRMPVTVTDAGGLSSTAWTYLYNRLTDALVPIKNGCWLPLR